MKCISCRHAKANPQSDTGLECMREVAMSCKPYSQGRHYVPVDGLKAAPQVKVSPDLIVATDVPKTVTPQPRTCPRKACRRRLKAGKAYCSEGCERADQRARSRACACKPGELCAVHERERKFHANQIRRERNKDGIAKYRAKHAEKKRANPQACSNCSEVKPVHNVGLGLCSACYVHLRRTGSPRPALAKVMT